MKNLNNFSELLVQACINDPGVSAQLVGLDNPYKILKAQALGEIEEFDKLNLVSTKGENIGLLIGYYSDILEKPEFFEALRNSSKYILEVATKDEIDLMQKHIIDVIEISQYDWYKKYVNNSLVYILQLIVIKKEFRGIGIFREMIEPIIENCDKNNIPIALQTHNINNIPKYEHFGFKVMEIIKSDKIDLTCYNMLRKK